MSADTLLRRYWRAFTGVPGATDAGPRGREGYSLWDRYWAALTSVRLPPAGQRRSSPPAVRHNPLTSPFVDGQRLRLPRFDRALRLAATGETERMSASWTVADRRFVLRESGPGEVDLLVETDREVPPTLVLPVHVAGPAGDRVLFMVFVRESPGRSVGVLRLPDVHGWIDITVDGEQAVADLDADDEGVLGRLADSVRATPDPGMRAWVEIVASRPAGDPLRQVIADSAR